ncbi:carbohydrate-binding module family 48 protein [Ramaria rubella]|nr:carbohydrate-binding module family 48 protein [Ramaria rubella]
MEGLHEATFIWPEVDAQEVVITGTFDQWSSSMHLTKSSRGFEGKIKLPWGSRVLYKFVVDGHWRTAQSQPEEADNQGNLNNVYECVS